MKFEDWWATLSPPERRVIGEHNARFVWNEAVRYERERIIAANAPEIERINSHIKALEGKGQ